MGGGLSATAAALLHARPGTGAGAAGFLSSPPLPASRPPSGLGDPWLPGPPSRPLSPPTSSARWSAAERRAAVQGGVGGATAVLALAALVLLAGRAAPPSALASPRSFLTASAAQGKELGLWGGASEGRGQAEQAPTTLPTPQTPPPILVSYAFYEKDAGQAANLDFFIAVGMADAGTPGVAGGGTSGATPTRRADFVLSISGPACTPCAGLARGLARLPVPPPLARTLTAAWGREGLTLLRRAENEGMDFGAHNASLAWAAAAAAAAAAGARGGARPGPPAPPTPALATAARYGHAFFIFLNSSARGPFLPAYLPAGWHWTRAFTDGLARDGCGWNEQHGVVAPAPPPTCLPAPDAPPAAAAAAALVAASLACLPVDDAGGPGPRAESWAFALSAGGLAVAEASGAFALRACKLCTDPGAGIVVGGEYGLSASILAAGQRLVTLQTRYARGVDWADPAHWGCNGCAHASRQGTYGPGLALHPFETLFVKASWGVGVPYLEPYTAWATGHARGDDPGTGAMPRAGRGTVGGGAGGGGPAGGGGGPADWEGPAACDLPLYRWAVSAEATAPGATAGVAACFVPPGLAGLVG